MIRRTIPAFVLLAVASVAAPAFAKSHVIATKSAYKHGRQVYISYGLRPGHRYKIVLTANGKHPFVAQLMEAYTYVNNGHFADGTKNFHRTGKTTASITVPSLGVKHVRTWQLVTLATLKSGKNLTVRYVQVK